MISEQALRNAVYDIKFSYRPGMHDNEGRPTVTPTLPEAMDELMRKLHLAPVRVPPMFIVEHEDGYGVRSKNSGNKYPLRHGFYMTPIGENLYSKFEYIDVELPRSRRVRVQSEDDAINTVSEYERSADFNIDFGRW